MCVAITPHSVALPLRTVLPRQTYTFPRHFARSHRLVIVVLLMAGLICNSKSLAVESLGGSWANPTVLADLLAAPSGNPPLQEFRIGFPISAATLCRRAANGLPLSEIFSVPDGGSCYWKIELPSWMDGGAMSNCDILTGWSRTASSHGSPVSKSTCPIDEARPSLFFFASSSQGWITFLRYKLNTNEVDRASNLEVLSEQVAELLGYLGLAFPSPISAAMKSGKSAKQELDGVDFSVVSEDGTMPRFDMIIGLPLVSRADLGPNVVQKCDEDETCIYEIVDY